MSRNFSYITLGLLCVVLLLVGATLLILIKEEPPSTVSFSAERISEVRAKMRRSISDVGGDAAYAELKRTYAGTSFDKNHNAAHLFGESLYDVEGIPAVAACDTSFNFGCYHGFFTTAVAAEGLGVVSALDAACGGVAVPGASACQHGLGHGILEYVGHDQLVKALTECGRTHQPDPLAGCTGGVFMEYNVPLIGNEDGSFSIGARPLTEEGAYAPCLALPEQFKGSCIQELPQWWQQVIGPDFTRMGELCANVGGEEYQRICIAGVGKIIPSAADYSVAGAERRCAAMPREWYDTCIMQASWAFETNTESYEEARELCSFISPSARSGCPQ
jgi:hypothetical protein